MLDLDRLEALAKAVHDRPAWNLVALGNCTLDRADSAYVAALHPGTALALIARLRATEALVERAYVEGFEDGEQVATFPHRDRYWQDSNARRALDRLREGA